MKSQLSNRSNHGFTLFEVIFVALIVGILSAIAAPSWLAFVNTRRLTTAQDQVYRAMREAQSNAKRDKVTWQASFRDNNGVVQWTVHRATDATPADWSWQKLDSNIRLDTNETSLPQSNSMWRVLFNYQGCPVYEVGNECTQTALNSLGQITLSSKNGGTAKRCVFISTLLGSLRTSKEQPQPQNGKYCY